MEVVLMPRIPPAFTFSDILAIACSSGQEYHRRRGTTTVAEFGVLDQFGGAWVEIQHRSASSVSSSEAHQTDRTLRPTTLVVLDDRSGDLDADEVKRWVELSAREGGTTETESGDREVVGVDFLGARANRDLSCGCGLRLAVRHDNLCRLLDACRKAGQSTIELSLLISAATTTRRDIFNA